MQKREKKRKCPSVITRKRKRDRVGQRKKERVKNTRGKKGDTGVDERSIIQLRLASFPDSVSKQRFRDGRLGSDDGGGGLRVGGSENGTSKTKEGKRVETLTLESSHNGGFALRFMILFLPTYDPSPLLFPLPVASSVK